MVLMLLEPTDNDNSYHALYTPHINGYSATMDSILASLLLAHAKLGPEGGLIPIKLAVHEPSAASPPQHRVPLALDPNLVVWHHSRSSDTVEDDLAGVGECDGYHCGFWERKKPGPEQVSENPSILYGEGVEGERVASCLQLIQLYSL